MEDRLANIKEQLRSEETEMLKLIELLKTQLAAKTKEVRRIQSALRELEGGTAKPSVKKAKKPAASKNDVRAAVITVLEELGVAEHDALKRIVETHIVESGKSRMGFALRLKEVLAEERFIDTPAGYRLAEHELATIPTRAVAN